MSRYIDADAAIKRFEELHGNENTLLNSYNADWIVSFIEGQPTADVQEVMHGHWIEKALDNFRKVECSCSICGWSGVENYDSYVDIHDFEYCPYCGAKMGEEEQQ